MDWQTLAARYGDRVLLISRSILREEGLSRDAAQETLLKLGRANGQVKNWDAWVLTVAGNTARDFLRKRRRAPAPLEVDRMETGIKSPDQAAIAKESTEQLTSAIAALPTSDRDILLLKFREGLKGPAIASALGISLTAAWQRLSRALQTLRTKLGVKDE